MESEVSEVIFQRPLMKGLRTSQEMLGEVLL